jgi:excisionase family DNA binding protein
MTAEVLTPMEVAAWLKVSRSWVYAAAARGELPGRRVGKQWRFDRVELQDWLAKAEAERPLPPPPRLKGGA